MALLAPSAYATTTDLTTYGIGGDALGTVDPGLLQGAMDAANAIADSFLRARFALPLGSWDAALVQNICKLAAAQAMRMRGFSPDGIDQSIRDGERDALEWFRGIGRGEVTPSVVDARGAAGPFGGAFVQQPQISDSDASVLVPASPRSRAW